MKEIGPEDFPTKWWKILEKMPEFKDVADGSSTDELKKIVLTCESNLFTIDNDLANDATLQSAKELVKTTSAPHKEAAKFQTVKIKYAVYLLESKGVKVETKTKK